MSIHQDYVRLWGSCWAAWDSLPARTVKIDEAEQGLKRGVKESTCFVVSASVGGVRCWQRGTTVRSPIVPHMDDSTSPKPLALGQYPFSILFRLLVSRSYSLTSVPH